MAVAAFPDNIFKLYYKPIPYFLKMAVNNIFSRTHSSVKKKKLLLLLSIFLAAALSCSSPPTEDENLSGYYDGPYILYSHSEAIVIRVNRSVEGSQIVVDSIGMEDINSKLVRVFPDSRKPDSSYLKPFEVRLFEFGIEERWDFPQPDRIFALSDIECHFSEYISILKAGEVIDENYDWIFGGGHLVINGDLFNRGHDLMALLWLTYKLDYQSVKAGGKVHLILGNHEEMALRGDVRYTVDRYLEFSNQIGIPYQELFGENSELGRWLRSKNTMVRIGNTLFVHGGISLEFLEKRLTIPEVNRLVRESLGKDRAVLEGNADFLFRTNGTFWYRGLVFTTDEVLPLGLDEVAEVVNYFQVDRIVVGHCKGPEIAKVRGDMVIAIDVNHTSNRRNGISRALLIKVEDGLQKLYKVNDNGELQEVSYQEGLSDEYKRGFIKH